MENKKDIAIANKNYDEFKKRNGQMNSLEQNEQEKNKKTVFAITGKGEVNKDVKVIEVLGKKLYVSGNTSIIFVKNGNKIGSIRITEIEKQGQERLEEIFKTIEANGFEVFTNVVDLLKDEKVKMGDLAEAVTTLDTAPTYEHKQNSSKQKGIGKKEFSKLKNSKQTKQIIKDSEHNR